MPFYVGKGKGDRYQDTCNRSPRFKEEHEKGGCFVEVVGEFALEADAFAHEVELIRILGRRDVGGPLINQSNGGEGPAGHINSEETRAKMSASQRIRRSRRQAPRKASSAKMTVGMHLSGPRTKNSTGYKGVSLHAPGTWVAKIHAFDKQRYIGLYNSPEDAARAYDAAAVKAWGLGLCYLNFPADYRRAA